MIHSGSRGLGYQVCDDYLREMGRAVAKYKLDLPDRQLASAPLSSPEGRGLLRGDGLRGQLRLGQPAVPDALDQGDLPEDPGHLAARPRHEAGLRRVPQHRQEGNPHGGGQAGGGSAFTARARPGPFPPAIPRCPSCYRSVGQPVLIPGDMGTNSYVLVGTELAMRETFGSTCHGAGRVRSRTQSKKLDRRRPAPEGAGGEGHTGDGPRQENDCRGGAGGI